MRKRRRRRRRRRRSRRRRRRRSRRRRIRRRRKRRRRRRRRRRFNVGAEGLLSMIPLPGVVRHQRGCFHILLSGWLSDGIWRPGGGSPGSGNGVGVGVEGALLHRELGGRHLR
jgi:hypothetical protein